MTTERDAAVAALAKAYHRVACGYSDHPDGEPGRIQHRIDRDAAHIAAWSPDRALAALEVIRQAHEIEAVHRPVEAADDACWDALRDALDRWEAL